MSTYLSLHRTPVIAIAVVLLGACSGAPGVDIGPGAEAGGGGGGGAGRDAGMSGKDSGAHRGGDGGGTGDASRDGSSGDGFTGDGHSGSTEGGGDATASGVPIACGKATCSGPAEVCCVPDGTSAGACVTGSTCPNPGDTRLECTSNADCSGSQVCCLTQQTTTVARCASFCGGGNPQLCELGVTPSGCPSGQTCQPADGGMSLPTNVGVCGG